MNQLERLKHQSTVVADTGDFQQLAQFAPRDATTNPSLVLKAVQLPAYRPLLERVVAARANDATPEVADRLLVAFGMEILKLVPGRVSTEVDARLSFDIDGTVARAPHPERLRRGRGRPLARPHPHQDGRHLGRHPGRGLRPSDDQPPNLLAELAESIRQFEAAAIALEYLIDECRARGVN